MLEEVGGSEPPYRLWCEGIRDSLKARGTRDRKRTGDDEVWWILG